MSMDDLTDEELERQMMEAIEAEAAENAAAGGEQVLEVEAEAVTPTQQTATEAPAVAPPAPAPVAASAHFEQLAGTATDGSSAPLSTLYDLSLPISIELGRTSMKVQEVLKLGRGSVIELDRLAGEPVDVYVGDRRFAEGEVVVLGENFGVRITRILPAGRLEVA